MMRAKGDKSETQSDGSFMARVGGDKSENNLSMFKSDDSCIERLETSDGGSFIRPVDEAHA